MEKHHLSAVLLFMVPAFLSLAASSSFIGRILLQTQQDCPVDFGRSDITILISKCKGPEYPTEACCGAFKKFACPYADILNDLNNNCAASMFAYINLYFPDGLFLDKCIDSERGVECPDSYAYPPSPFPSPALIS